MTSPRAPARFLQFNTLREFEEFVTALNLRGNAPRELGATAPHMPLVWDPLPPLVAQRLVETLSQEGVEVGKSPSAFSAAPGAQRVLAFVSSGQIARLASRARSAPLSARAALESLATGFRSIDRQKKGWLRLAGGRRLRLGGKTLVMGVVNVTPDSFSDGGKFFSTEAAIAQGIRLVQEGADLLDIGGESTRPSARFVSEAEEARRVLPVLEGLLRKVEIPLSIDTRRPSVARKALALGVGMVNDVSGLALSAMRRVVRDGEAAAVAMHMRGTPATMQKNTEYRDLRGEVFNFLAERTRRALADGIPRDRLIVDPGIGFGKSPEGNVELIDHAGEFRSLGFPVLIGASRKSFLGVLTGGAMATERLEASLGAAVLSALRGADIVRVHDVQETVRALAIAQAIRP